MWMDGGQSEHFLELKSVALTLYDITLANIQICIIKDFNMTYLLTDFRLAFFGGK